MELFEYIKSQLPQMPNSAIMKQLGASEELIDYVKETPWNTNWNVIGSIADSGGGADAEVWLIGNTYEDLGSVRMFVLSNVGDIDHMAELLANSDNYQVFLNGEELPFIDKGSDTVIWTDGDMSASYSKDVTIMAQESIAEFLDVSTAPTSVEVSVKVK